MKKILFLTAGCLMMFVTACDNGNSGSPLETQLREFKQENKQLRSQITTSTSQIKDLEKNVQTLSGLPQGTAPNRIYTLKSIKITKYTNIYDKDEVKDGKKETFIVYIQPIDSHGDLIKAAGIVNIQLWDLNKKTPDALLAEWDIDSQQLKKLWYSSMLSTNYRFDYNIAEKITNEPPTLTVKVKFTDILTGKILEAQKLITPEY